MKSALLPLLIATTLAQSPVKDYLFFNASSPAPYNGSATFLAADTNPNETHTVTFNRDNSTTSGRNWTWTLGLSNVSFPNVSSSAPPDAHVAYVTYDFSWPSGGDTIDQAVSDTQGSSCLIYLWAYFPRSVSNEYDPSSSSCESALGKECVEALTQLTLYGESNDCESQSLFLTLPACEGSLGRIVSQGAATLGRSFGNSSAEEGDAEMSYQNGTTFAWQLSDPYAPGNDTIYRQEKYNLHVIGFTRTVGDMTEKQLLCNRVAVKTDDEDDNDDDDESMASRGAHVSLVALVGAVIFAVWGLW